MVYVSEEIIHALKKGREAKGLSQRALGARTGLPQGHISRIEGGHADIRLSSLVELARALDLEIKLLPRQVLPAVDSIVRSMAPVGPAAASHRHAFRELQRALGAVEALRLQYPDLSVLNQLRDNLRTIGHFKTVDTCPDSIRRVTRPLNALQKHVSELQQTDAAVSLPRNRLPALEEAAERAQGLRDRLVHAAPPASPRPAYRLDDNDEDHHEHEDLGDG